MKISSLKYLTREGFRNVWVNRLMSLASVGVLVSCLVLMGCATMMSLNINVVLKKIEDQNVVMVFIKDGLTTDQIQEVKTDIMDAGNIDSCTFIAKDKAWKEQLSEMGPTAAEFFKGYSADNPLPDSFKVTLKDMKQFKTTVGKLKVINNVDTVRENSNLADKLTRIRKTVTAASLAIIVMLFIVSLFIIANTIKLTMYSRRLEISIMKSVGATNGFVRYPFVVEGMALGIIAGFLSLLLVYLIYIGVIGQFTSVLPMEKAVKFSSVLFPMLVGFLVIGISTGVGGSLISIGKYLKTEGSEISAV